jgi:hypothetical protein
VLPLRVVLRMRVVLRIIGLSPSSYHAWRREQPCPLEQGSACPRSVPQQLTPTNALL